MLAIQLEATLRRAVVYHEAGHPTPPPITALSKRHRLTISDYAVVALCPSLIVLLLSSLVYFVILCVYQGGYSLRLGYIWFMFILGTVNIARLSIEQSRGYATSYAAVLGIATFFVLSRFQTFDGGTAAIAPIVNLLVIAGVWFLADRITYDCTLIDDDDDASGQGLLDGLSSSDGETAAQPQAESATVVDGSGSDGATQAAAKPRRRKKKHQPGRTVLWLAAASLPIFGAGQVFLRSDPGLQRSALFALAIYLFATLSLLVATSFLGVRRYLRQRGVEMPSNVSTAWLGGGIITTAIILLLCFALPQPGQMLANLELPASLQSPDWLKPSQYGWGSETAESDHRPQSSGAPASKPDGQSDGESDGGDDPQQSQSGQADGKPGDGKPGESGSAQGDEPGEAKIGDQQGGKEPANPSGGEQSGGEQSGGEKSGGENSGNQADRSQSDASEKGRQSQQNDGSQQNEDAQNGESSPTDSQPPEPKSESSQPAQISQWLPSLTHVLKAIIYLVLLGIIAAFLWINRAAIADFWNRITDWLSGRKFASTTSASTADALLAPTAPMRPFASFTNPLTQGAEPRRAVIETFQATEAWYREQGHPRRGDETPQEYTNRLTKTGTADHAAITRLTDAYNRVVYGGGSANQEDLQSVKAMWQSFRGGNA